MAIVFHNSIEIYSQIHPIDRYQSRLPYQAQRTKAESSESHPQKIYTKIHLNFDQDDNGPEYGTGRYPEENHQQSKMATSQGPLVLTKPSIFLISKSEWFPEISHHAHGAPIILVGVLEYSSFFIPSTMTKLTYKGWALLSSTQKDMGAHPLETTCGGGVGTPTSKLNSRFRPTEFKNKTPQTKTVERHAKNMQRLPSRSQQ
ncbi:hypothetical protein BOTCAL_0038g00320 [Botryotinia calthae]|uniref:Uncharacterized protein n=1 Tax=Botryotinia calthae TaxID=38488 RepID=A0A4Y8DCM1_9HELO|nr:hypothetical protein BOTCAL_0038g00320 [Botryotinia calthae]